ncbi:activator-dependent family glycosyltransferase [Micromonospora sp. NPDC049559]|uniref:activator-dependent family glycosyltransferase n=1 Tax=Micromonospora sp. NPDC049559 TaxID=3155923 RepID=UPI00341EED0C
MRVLFTTFAAKVHMFTQVPLAWALQTAGHEVCVASHPDLVESIRRTGLTAVPVGEPLNLDAQMKQVEDNLHGDEAPAEPDGQQGDGQQGDEPDLDITETRPEKLTWDYLLGTFTAMTSVVFQNQCAESMTDDLVSFARSWGPDLVVWDTMTFAGPVAAKASGAAHARLLFGLDHIARMRASFLDLLSQRPEPLRDDPLREWLTWTLARYGCEFGEDAVVGQFTIDPTPAWMRFPLDLHYVPFRYVPYNGPSTYPDWLREPPKRRRVCISLGLSHREVQGGDEVSVTDLLEAVADLDVEVVATLDPKQLDGVSVPENVRAVDFVPLNALLPTCSAMISHGGSGTCGTALVHGVPQLIVPAKIWDSLDKAERLADYGAALYVRHPERLTVEELRGKLLRLLDEPSFRQRARQLRREILGTPAPNQIVPVLERLTAEHRSAR